MAKAKKGKIEKHLVITPEEHGRYKDICKEADVNMGDLTSALLKSVFELRDSLGVQGVKDIIDRAKLGDKKFSEKQKQPLEPPEVSCPLGYEPSAEKSESEVASDETTKNPTNNVS